MNHLLKGLIFILSVNPLFSQYSYGDLNFDNNDFVNSGFYVDTLTSKWKVGIPNKINFNSAYSPPNAIFIDTSDYYPQNDTSIFILSMKDGFHGNSFDGVPHIDFYHKYDMDSLNDGGFLEVSYNNGTSWENVVLDSLFTTYPGFWGFGSGNFYSETDTLNDGEPAFTGKSDGWVYSEIHASGCWYDWFMDSIMVRFVFRSDSIADTKEGWLIDDISFATYICSGIGENQTILFNLYPNPVKDVLNIEFDKYGEFEFNVFDLHGTLMMHQKVNGKEFHFDYSHLPSGFFMFNVRSNGFDKTIRLFKH